MKFYIRTNSKKIAGQQGEANGNFKGNKRQVKLDQFKTITLGNPIRSPVPFIKIIGPFEFRDHEWPFILGTTGFIAQLPFSFRKIIPVNWRIRYSPRDWANIEYNFPFLKMTNVCLSSI